MRLKSIFSIALLTVVSAPLVLAVQGMQIPEIVTPEALRPYADANTVEQNARSVIELLKSAEFRKLDDVESDCDTEPINSFYRGMHLAHLAYYLFVSKQEIGWFEDKSPSQTYPPRAFVSLGRSILLRTWTSDRIVRLLSLTSAINELPVSERKDIVAFLTKLRDFRAYHDNLRPVRDQLQELNRRLDSPFTLRHWRLFVPPGGIEALAKRMQQTPMNFDEELRRLLNKVRHGGQPELEACYEAGMPYALTLKDGPKIESTKFLLPIFYMLRFWDRREAEGMSDLAEFILSRVIAGIKVE